MNTAEFSIMPHLGIVFLLLQLYPEFGSREPIPHIISFVYLHEFYPRYLRAFRNKLELENQKPSKQRESIEQSQERRMQLSYEYHLLVALFLLWFLSALNCRHWAVTLIFLQYLLWVLADSEITRWLNYGTKMLWPKLEEYGSKKVFQPIVDWVLEKHKPSTLKKARIQWLCLGSNPPTITEFHFFRNSDSNRGLVIELGIIFSADNHMHSILATKLRDGSGSGKLKLKMTNLCVDWKVLIMVNFINHHPFVSRLQVCFVEPPYFKMTVKPLCTSEVDKMKAPDIIGKLPLLTLDMERYAATCTDEVELAKAPLTPAVAEATSPTAPEVIESPPSPTGVTLSSLYAPTSGQELPTIDSTTSPVGPTILSDDANDTPRFPSSTSPEANQTATFKSTNPETSTVALGDIVLSTLPTFAHSPSISPSIDCQLSPFSVLPSKSVPTITGSTIELDSSKVSLPSPGELANVWKVLCDAVPTPTVTPLALVAEEVAALTAKEKCREFLKLSSGGFAMILSDLTFEAKVKTLLTAFCDNLFFLKHPQFQNHCKEYLTKLISGIETLKRNYDQLQSLASSERGYRAVASSIEKKRESTAELYESYKAMVQTEVRLAKEVAVLEAQLAEAKCQYISHKLQMKEMWHTLDVSTKKLDKVSKEAKDYVSNLDRQNNLRPQLMAENVALHEELMSFRVVVEKLLATL